MTNAYVYIIANGSAAVKIGKARNPHSRLKDLQAASHNPLALEHVVEYDEKTASKVEHAAHKLLHSDRLNGEWFSTSVEDAKKAIYEAQRIVENRAVSQSPQQELEESAIQCELGRRIRRRRMALALNQRQLAKRIGMLPTQLSRLENGEYQAINITMLVRLGDTLHTSLDYLLARSEDPGEVPDSGALQHVA